MREHHKYVARFLELRERIVRKVINTTVVVIVTAIVGAVASKYVRW